MADDDADHFSLRWNNFHSNLTSGFHSLLQSEDLVDVSLAADGRFIKAHKIVLSVCSPYFKQLFKVNPCKHPIVILKDVSYTELVSILQFMYKGEVNVRQEELSAFLKTAEILQIKGLTGDEPAPENVPHLTSQSRQEETHSHGERATDRSVKRTVADSNPTRISTNPSYVPRPASTKRPRVDQVPSQAQSNAVQFVELSAPKSEPVDYDWEVEKVECTNDAIAPLLEADMSLSHVDDDNATDSYDSPTRHADSGQLRVDARHSIVGSSAALPLMDTSQPGLDNSQGIAGIAGNSHTLDVSQDGSQENTHSQNTESKINTDLKSLHITKSVNQISTCDICHRSMHRSSLKRHMENCHFPKATAYCEGCGKQFKNKNSLRTHNINYHKF